LHLGLKFQENQACVQVLLDHFARTKTKSDARTMNTENDGNTPLMIALAFGKYEIKNEWIDLLMPKAIKDKVLVVASKAGYTAVHYCCHYRNGYDILHIRIKLHPNLSRSEVL